MKLKYVVLTSLMVSGLNVMAAEVEQPSVATHRRYDTGVVRTAFEDEQEKIQHLQQLVDKCVAKNKVKKLNFLLKIHRDTPLRGIVAAGLAQLEEQQKKDAESLLPAPSASSAARAAHSGKRVSFAPSAPLDIKTIRANLNKAKEEIENIKKIGDESERQAECARVLKDIEAERAKLINRGLNAAEFSLAREAAKLHATVQNLNSGMPEAEVKMKRAADEDAKLFRNNADRKMERLAKWAAAGVVASVVLVAAIVWYFKYFKPATAAQ